MNCRQALARARSVLENTDIEDASLESEILLRHVLGIDRAQLYADLGNDLSPEQENALDELLERRRRGEPSAYITGHREFYGLDFTVDRNVLVPRPETELLVEKALQLAESRAIRTIADIGTGCGAIAVSLAVNLPGVIVQATDVSPEALEVARTNCRRHGVEGRVVLLKGSLLEPLGEPVDVIVANLPYVRKTDIPQKGPLSYEPEVALQGGEDGLDIIRSLCCQAGEKLNKRGSMLLEIGVGQAEGVTDILNTAFPASTIDIYKDLADIERAVVLSLT